MVQITKQLSDISWNVSEKTYRDDPALSYSTIAKYDREGFNNLDKLFEHINTPSLTLGSCVDTLITGSQEEFNKLFYVADFPSIGEKEKKVVDTLYSRYCEQYSSLPEIPDDIILNVVGGMVGYFMYKFFNKLANTFPKIFKSQIFLDIITIICFIAFSAYILWR